MNVKELVREIYNSIETSVDFISFAKVATKHINMGMQEAQDEIGVWDDDYEDESGVGGYWDYAGEIATDIGIELEGETRCIFAEDWGQELIYNFIKK